jgi:hypothetical protein
MGLIELEIHFHTALVAFGIYFKFRGLCLGVFCLHVEEPASGSEEGSIQEMHNTEQFFILFLCLFTVGRRALIKCGVSVGQKMLYKK